MEKNRYKISEINSVSKTKFVELIGAVFEHSPWISEVVVDLRPFVNLESLHGALCRVVSNSSEAKQIALIQAHPDLVGRAAQDGSLTAASTQEQASAGLGKLSHDEIELFRKFNAAYHEKFGFPFVICARLNKKQTILSSFRVRLKNSQQSEIKTALDEIFKIARLRLRDIFQT